MAIFNRLFRGFLTIFLFIQVSIAQQEQVFLKGEVIFFLFDEQVPKEQVKITINDQWTHYTNADGLVEINLDPGSYRARVYQREIKFRVVSGETTLVNYNVVDGSSALETKNLPGGEKHVNDFSQWPSVFRGNVKSQGSKKKISGVRVFVHGSEVETLTDKEGDFEVHLPSGHHSISFIHEDYATETLDNLKFEEGKPVSHSITLKPTGLELEEFIVLSPTFRSSVSALLAIRRGHQTVADVISSEQISKSGDSNAGGSLRRVTGLSLVDGKHIYVRGLGERYSKTVLNGADIPSPNPSKRVVPLDIFPSSMVENIVVQKGYSPEMPGEFGGGVIQIKTKTLPPKAYTRASFSLALEDYPFVKTYKGGDIDYLGFDRGRRDIPRQIQDEINANVNVSGLSSDRRKELAAAINKSYDVNKTNPREKYSLSLSTGDRVKWGKVRVGYNVAALYSNKWRFNKENRMTYDRDSKGLVLDSQSELDHSKNRVQLGSLVGLGLKYRKLKIGYNGTLLRNTLNFVTESQGEDSENDLYRRIEHGWLERSIESHQFYGENILRFLNDGKLNYNYTYSKALMDEPDHKMYTYKKMDDLFRIETENGSASNYVSWRYMPDRMRNLKLIYEQPVNPGVKIISGLTRVERSRKFSSWNFYFRFDDINSLDRIDQDPVALFSHPSAELYQQISNTDNYFAQQSINGYFFNIRSPVWRFDIFAGMRFEKSTQEVQSFKLFGGGRTISKLITRDYFPALSVTFNLLDNLQLRSNYSETISRPDLREISNTTWKDLDEGVKFTGNPYLNASEMRNYGVRLEWFPQRGEVLSLGYFKKDFIHPIENVFGSLKSDGTIIGTTDNRYTFLNIDSAHSQGLEFEFRKKLPFYLTLGGNYTWIRSGIYISPERAGQLTSLQRPLQGQSPYMFNLQIDFEPKTIRSTFTLLYNSIGQRITGVGSDGRPDEYERQISSLDFLFSTRIYKNIKIKGQAKNLLDPEVKRTQGTYLTRSFYRGRTYALGLNASF